MKRILKPAALCLAAILFLSNIFMVYAADTPKSVDILFFHDTHSHLDSFSTVENREAVTVGGHGNQFSKTSQILEGLSKQSSIIFDIALFDEILALYCFSRLIENLRSRFKFCWIVLFSMRQ